MKMTNRLLLGLWMTLALMVAFVSAQGPLTNALNLRTRTDANGYLIGKMAAYTAPDGPLTALANLRLRTDSNGYLLTTMSGAQVMSGTLTFSPDATYDIGAAAATRPRNIYTASYIFPGNVTFASLGSPASGAMIYCSDCAPTTPATCPATKASCVCTGSGTGSLAVRLNSVWDCGTFQ